MSPGSVKTGGLALPHGRREHLTKEKSQSGQEMGLILAFVVLLVLALYVVI